MIMKRLKNKIIRTILVATLCISLLSSCTSTSIQDATNQTTSKVVTPISVDFDSDDLESSWTDSEASKITLIGDSIAFDGNGATVSGNKITITSSGVYTVTGTLKDGQIIVNSQDKGTIQIVLNGANIKNLKSSPIYVQKAEKTVITLAENTKNTITDSKSYVLEDEENKEPDAAIFSKDNLTINGLGSLVVNGNYKSGITSKDELKIVSGNIIVNAVTDGLKGRDFIALKDGNITITAKSDGMQANNDEDTSKGFVYIEKGNIKITAGSDGIQAETQVLIKGGDVDITTGGGSEVATLTNENQKTTKTPINTTATDTESAKGIKAGVDITIDSGTFSVNSSDDAIHSNSSITINDGSLKLSSGDDGIHSDTSIVLNGGDLDIEKSYEGIESESITINDGSIHVTSSDDGINTSAGNDDSAVTAAQGQKKMDSSDGSSLNIKGGYVVVDSQGDGIDANGSITMSAGTVVVNGPTNNGNGALDYNGTFDMSGGFLVAAGSAGMAVAPSTTSTQNTLKINIDSQTANTLIHIESESGENILTFSPTKNYQSVIISSPKLKKDSTYTVYTGGSSSGSKTDGLFAEGTYSPGTKLTSVKITGSVTEYRSAAANTGAGGQMPTNGERPAKGNRPVGDRPEGDRPAETDDAVSGASPQDQ